MNEIERTDHHGRLRQKFKVMLAHDFAENDYRMKQAFELAEMKKDYKILYGNYSQFYVDALHIARYKKRFIQSLIKLSKIYKLNDDIWLMTSMKNLLKLNQGKYECLGETLAGIEKFLRAGVVMTEVELEDRLDLELDLLSGGAGDGKQEIEWNFNGGRMPEIYAKIDFAGTKMIPEWAHLWTEIKDDLGDHGEHTQDFINGKQQVIKTLTQIVKMERHRTDESNPFLWEGSRKPALAWADKDKFSTLRYKNNEVNIYGE